MLHKKKRWTAAMHGSSQSPVPVLLPAASSPNKNQWPNFPVNTGTKPMVRYPTPPSSVQLQKGPGTPSVPSNDGFPPAPQISPSRPASVVDNHQSGSNRLSATHEAGDIISNLCAAGMRGDIAASLLNSLVQSTELLQQPGLLLQILPQEYIEKYAKNLERRMTSEKIVHDLVNPAGNGNNRASESSFQYQFRGGHRADSGYASDLHHLPSPGTSHNFPSGYKPSPVDPTTKPMRSTPSGKASLHSQPPMFSDTMSPDPQSFSPSSRSTGGSSESHLLKNWNPSLPLPTAHQITTGLDFSTSSAVVHAANLLHSSSAAVRQSAALGLFTPWENAGLISREAARSENNSIPKQPGPMFNPGLSVTPGPLGIYPDGTNPNLTRTSGGLSDGQKHRTPQNTPPLTLRVPTPVNMRTNTDSRRQTPKPTAPTCRPVDGRIHPATSNDPLRPLNPSSSWLPTDQTTSSTVGPEAADARLSILHDAKIAALSVDWPNASTTASVTAISNASTSFRNPRLRSSSSLSSPPCPELALLQATHQNSRTRDPHHTAPNSLTVLHRTKQMFGTNPVLGSIKSPPTPTGSSGRASVPIQNPLTLPPNLKSYVRMGEEKTASMNKTDKFDAWTHSVAQNCQLPPRASLMVNSCSEQVPGKHASCENHAHMPLKKRLIRRYEADSGSCPTKPEVPRKSSPSTSEPTDTGKDDGSVTKKQNSADVFALTKDEPSENSESLCKDKRHPELSGHPENSVDKKSSKRSVGSVVQRRGANASRKTSSRRSNPPTETSSSSATPKADKVTRKSIAQRTTGRAEIGAPSRRRTTSINGTHDSSITGRSGRTGSSTSRGSSCSLRSLDVEDTDDDVHTHVSDDIPDLKPAVRSNQRDVHSLSERPRKAKRAAALLAASAAAASVSSGAKRPRLSNQLESSVPPRTSEQGSVEEDSADTDDASSVLTTESNSAASSEKLSPLLEELSAVLTEDKTPLEELVQQLPGPPNLQQLTTRSLHPAHPMDYYKRNRTAFVQLVSCNDPMLKPIPKCRACRQLKRSHYDLNDPDLMGSDEEKSNSAHTNNTGTSQDGGEEPFKRPSGKNAVSLDGKSRRRAQASSPVSVFCRFWGFRRLVFNHRGVLKIAGFCQSNEANEVDRSLWEMHHTVSPQLEPESAKYIIERAGTLFCRLLRQELAVLSGRGSNQNTNVSTDRSSSKNGLRRGASRLTSGSGSVEAVAWKRPVKGVREMCDVCETTMFNTHWVCGKCGYSVCVDCQEEARENKLKRKLEGENGSSELSTSRDKNKGKQPRARAGPPGWASCTTTRQHHDPERLLLTSLLPASTVGKLLHRVHRIARHYHIRLECGCPVSFNPSDAESSLNLLADLALKPDNVVKTETSSECERRLDNPLLPPHTWIRKPNPSGVSDDYNSKYLVLQLHNSQSPGLFDAFQHEWRANRPVVVSGCQSRFTSSMWTPRSFAEEFGQLRTTLVDCATGMELTRYPLRTFWDGFERKSRRLVSKDGRALCLKLKDWPTTDDFAELQPQRFTDLMTNLPLPAYTCRDGQLNLATRLTSFFVRPDLGPKLYVAYGTGGSRSMGTTNLHVDIADAINIMLYVGYPNDSSEESNANAEAVLNVMRQAQLDPVYLDRASRWSKAVQQGGQTSDENATAAAAAAADTENGPPGALWHIFLPEDMPALREFLTRVTEEENGAPLEAGSDPVHDQLFYLDQPLLDRLYSSTGIMPCTLIQFQGDAVFIPAGAAHQVRNLNSSVKAAVDFVAPEHLPQCFQLIEEFRRLSSTHQNHEDKLQVKNMLYHGIKDALSVLLCSAELDQENASNSDHGKGASSSLSRSRPLGRSKGGIKSEESSDSRSPCRLDCSPKQEGITSPQLIGRLKEIDDTK